MTTACPPMQRFSLLQVCVCMCTCATVYPCMSAVRLKMGKNTAYSPVQELVPPPKKGKSNLVLVSKCDLQSKSLQLCFYNVMSPSSWSLLWLEARCFPRFHNAQRLRNKEFCVKSIKIQSTYNILSSVWHACQSSIISVKKVEKFCSVIISRLSWKKDLLLTVICVSVICCVFNIGNVLVKVSC